MLGNNLRQRICLSCKNPIQLDEAITRHRADCYHDRCLVCCCCKQKLSGSFAFRKNERLCLDCASRRTFSAKSLDALFEAKDDSYTTAPLSPRGHTNDKSPRSRYWDNPPTAIAEIPDLPVVDLLKNTSSGILAVQQRRATEVSQVWKNQQTSTKPPDDLDVTSIASDSKVLQRPLPSQHSTSKKAFPITSGLSLSSSGSGRGHNPAAGSGIAIPGVGQWQLPGTGVSQSLPSTHSHALHSSSDTNGSLIPPELSTSPPSLTFSHSLNRSPATSPPASPRGGPQTLLGIGKGRFTPSPTGGSPAVQSPAGSWVSSQSSRANAGPVLNRSLVIPSASSNAPSPNKERPNLLGSRGAPTNSPTTKIPLPASLDRSPTPTSAPFVRVYVDSTNSLVSLNEKDEVRFSEAGEPRTVGDLITLLEASPLFQGKTLMAYTARQHPLLRGTLAVSSVAFVRVEAAATAKGAGSVLSLSTGSLPISSPIALHSANAANAPSYNSPLKSPRMHSPASSSPLPPPILPMPPLNLRSSPKGIYQLIPPPISAGALVTTEMNLPPPPPAPVASNLRSSPMGPIYNKIPPPISASAAATQLSPDSKPLLASPNISPQTRGIMLSKSRASPVLGDPLPPLNPPSKP